MSAMSISGTDDNPPPVRRNAEDKPPANIRPIQRRSVRFVPEPTAGRPPGKSDGEMDHGEDSEDSSIDSDEEFESERTISTLSDSDEEQSHSGSSSWGEWRIPESYSAALHSAAAASELIVVDLKGVLHAVDHAVVVARDKMLCDKQREVSIPLPGAEKNPAYNWSENPPANGGRYVRMKGDTLIHGPASLGRLPPGPLDSKGRLIRKPQPPPVVSKRKNVSTFLPAPLGPPLADLPPGIQRPIRVAPFKADSLPADQVENLRSQLLFVDQKIKEMKERLFNAGLWYGTPTVAELERYGEAVEARKEVIRSLHRAAREGEVDVDWKLVPSRPIIPTMLPIAERDPAVDWMLRRPTPGPGGGRLQRLLSVKDDALFKELKDRIDVIEFIYEGIEEFLDGISTTVDLAILMDQTRIKYRMPPPMGRKPKRPQRLPKLKIRKDAFEHFLDQTFGITAPEVRSGGSVDSALGPSGASAGAAAAGAGLNFQPNIMAADRQRWTGGAGPSKTSRKDLDQDFWDFGPSTGGAKLWPPNTFNQEPPSPPVHLPLPAPRANRLIRPKVKATGPRQDGGESMDFTSSLASGTFGPGVPLTPPNDDGPLNLKID